jgi:hypothetical protein
MIPRKFIALITKASTGSMIALETIKDAEKKHVT